MLKVTLSLQCSNTLLGDVDINLTGLQMLPFPATTCLASHLLVTQMKSLSSELAAFADVHLAAQDCALDHHVGTVCI